MSVNKWRIALLCSIGLALPVAAQEDTPPSEPPAQEAKAPAAEPAPAKSSPDDPALHRWGGWTISLAAWNPTLVGAEEEVATFFSGDVAQPLMLGADARIKETLRVSYHLPKDHGSVVAQYDAMLSDDMIQALTPGVFGFNESRIFPLVAGAFDDGLSDGVFAHAIRRTREFRLEYQNRAFETKWARGTWGIGYRQLAHNRQLEITYYALVPNLPPLIPPAAGADDAARLAPVPDGVAQDSNFSGHGLGASLDVEFPVHRRVSIISGLSIGLVRGTTRSNFSSLTSYYALNSSPDTPLAKQELFDILAAAASCGDSDPPDPNCHEIGDVSQFGIVAPYRASKESQMGQSFDLYLGVQVLAYKGLRVFATWRDVSYVDVGQYVTPTIHGSTERTSLNAAYEGYAVGLSYRF